MPGGRQRQGHGHSGAAALGVSRNGLFWEPAGSGGGLLGSLAQNQFITRPVPAFLLSSATNSLVETGRGENRV